MQGADQLRRIVFITLAMLVASLVFVARVGAEPGQVRTVRKISATHGSLRAPIEARDQFGAAVAAIGDLDGDGLDEIAVGAVGDDDGGSGTGAVWIVSLHSDGSVKGQKKISAASGGFSGALSAADLFGRSVTALGDLDNDGIPDIAVGASQDDDGGRNNGAVWVMFLNSDGSVKRHTKISETSGGFKGLLDSSDNFGASVAGLGDINGDGTPDLAVGSPFDDDGGNDRGAAYVLFLTPSGTVSGYRKIADGGGSLDGHLHNNDRFGEALASAGDINGDGIGDLVVGAPRSDEVGSNSGAVWVLQLTADGSVAVQTSINGSGGNLPGVLSSNDRFGYAVAKIGDLDGDGRSEIAVAANGDAGGGFERGAYYVLGLKDDGSVQWSQKVSHQTGGFPGLLDDKDNFGSALAGYPDLDGDGSPEILVGALNDDDGESDRGALYVLGLDRAVCGDGVLEGSEQCDDGNTAGADCCSPDCVFEPARASCSDGNTCNGAEACDGIGTCVAGTALVCDDGNVCTDDLCDALSGCVIRNNTASCEDGSSCTVGDTCAAGVCTAGATADCNDGNVCTDDACSELIGCLNTPNAVTCDDGNLCTVGDTCSAGTCTAGEPLVCDDGNLCTDETCAPSRGCVVSANTVPCDDSNVCTDGDVCSAGTCVGGDPVVCDDANACTDETCDPVGGCAAAPNDAACDDGDPCTAETVCSAGACTVAATDVCDDGNPCTDDACDASAGCTHSNNQGTCDDGDLCTTGEVCWDGECGGGSRLVCDDGNPCTDDFCDMEIGCAVADNADPCDDGNACTSGDRCTRGACAAAGPLRCDDGNVCTDDTCEPSVGCLVVNNAAPCDDGNLCTADDVCREGECAQSEPVVCDDGNVCTDDFCDPAQGCFAVANTAPCDDRDLCTFADRCADGECTAGIAADCDDGNVCTEDACNFAIGCIYEVNVQDCDDDDSCTLADRCLEGACVGGDRNYCDELAAHAGDLDFGNVMADVQGLAVVFPEPE